MHPSSPSTPALPLAALLDVPLADARPQPPALELLRPLFPKLDILRHLGSGGMAHVFAVRHQGLDEDRALKILVHDELPAAQASEAIQRFQNEGRRQARNRHPHSVTVHDCGQSEDMSWIEMEHLPGGDLAHALKHRLITPRQALDLMPGICDALHHAHQQGIIHRDVKPANILLNADRTHAKIADFGIANSIAPGAAPALTMTGQHLGTPGFTAPEGNRDARSDIWSLGSTLEHIANAARDQGCALPTGLRAIITKAKADEPEDRYVSAADLKAALRTIAGTVSSPPRMMLSQDSVTEPSRLEEPLSTQQRATRILRLIRLGTVWRIFVSATLAFCTPMVIAEVFYHWDWGNYSHHNAFAKLSEHEWRVMSIFLHEQKDRYMLTAIAIGWPLGFFVAYRYINQFRTKQRLLLDTAPDTELKLFRRFRSWFRRHQPGAGESIQDSFRHRHFGGFVAGHFATELEGRFISLHYFGGALGFRKQRFELRVDNRVVSEVGNPSFLTPVILGHAQPNCAIVARWKRGITWVAPKLEVNGLLVPLRKANLDSILAASVRKLACGLTDRPPQPFNTTPASPDRQQSMHTIAGDRETLRKHAEVNVFARGFYEAMGQETGKLAFGIIIAVVVIILFVIGLVNAFG